MTRCKAFDGWIRDWSWTGEILVPETIFSCTIFFAGRRDPLRLDLLVSGDKLGYSQDMTGVQYIGICFAALLDVCLDLFQGCCWIWWSVLRSVFARSIGNRPSIGLPSA